MTRPTPLSTEDREFLRETARKDELAADLEAYVRTGRPIGPPHRRVLNVLKVKWGETPGLELPPSGRSEVTEGLSWDPED